MLRIFFLMMVIATLISCATAPAPKPTSQVATLESLGDVYAQARHYEEAEGYYQKALNIEPEKTAVLFKLADTEVQLGKLENANELYKNIVTLNPNDHKARYRLARVSMSLGDSEIALTQYKILLQADKKDFHALNGLAVLLDHANKHEIAQGCYRKGLKYSPRDFSLLNNLGISYALSGDLEKSRQSLILSSQGSTTNSRPKDNLELINHYYKDIKKVADRQKALSNSLLIKINTVNQQLVNSAIYDAKEWCKA